MESFIELLHSSSLQHTVEGIQTRRLGEQGSNGSPTKAVTSTFHSFFSKTFFQGR
jgi:hypothetical protein